MWNDIHIWVTFISMTHLIFATRIIAIIKYHILVKHSKCRKIHCKMLCSFHPLKNSVHGIKRFEISKKASQRTCSVHKVYLRECVFFTLSDVSPFSPMLSLLVRPVTMRQFVRHLGPNNSMLVHFKHQFLFKLPTIKFLFLISELGVSYMGWFECVCVWVSFYSLHEFSLTAFLLDYFALEAFTVYTIRYHTKSFSKKW